MKNFWMHIRISGVISFILTGAIMVAFAAAPLSRNFKGSDTSDTVTSTAAVLDSVIRVASDSANSILQFTATATLNPGEVLYIGFGNDSANQVSASNTVANSDIDTFTIKAPKEMVRGTIVIPVSCRYVSTTNGANTDTFYVNAWVSPTGQQVELADMVLTASVADQ